MMINKNIRIEGNKEHIKYIHYYRNIHGQNSKGIQKRIWKSRKDIRRSKAFLILVSNNYNDYSKDKIQKYYKKVKKITEEIITLHIALLNDKRIEELNEICERTEYAKNIMINFIVINKDNKVLLTLSGNGYIQYNIKTNKKELRKVFVSLTYRTNKNIEKYYALRTLYEHLVIVKKYLELEYDKKYDDNNIDNEELKKLEEYYDYIISKHTHEVF